MQMSFYSYKTAKTVICSYIYYIYCSYRGGKLADDDNDDDDNADDDDDDDDERPGFEFFLLFILKSAVSKTLRDRKLSKLYL